MKILREILTILIFLGLIIGVSLLEAKTQEIKADLTDQVFCLENTFLFLGQNTLISLSSPNNPEPKVEKEIRMIVTAYSSTPWETDDTPFITASGTYVRDGIVANNLLSFGTKIRLPELYGNKIFVVEDRMNRRKGPYHLDIWFPSHQEAKEFGAKLVFAEILKN